MRARRVVALILSVLLILGVLPISASAVGRTPMGMIDEYQEKSGDANFVAEHQAVLERIFEGCLNHEESISVLDFKLPVSDYYPLESALRGIFPELFFLGTSSGSISATVSGNYLYAVEPNYTVDKETADAMLEEFYTKADEYLALVNDEMDQFTKALVLHDALALNSYYQIGTTEGVTDSTNYTFMVEGWGRCENYAECYAFLLAHVGIKSEIISSSSMSHEWMKINLDGSDYYYHVDLTWDDPSYGDEGDRPDQAPHKYFLLSDDMIGQDHSGYQSITQTDDAYDYLTNLHDLDNPLFYLNGELYTLYEKSAKGYLATYDYTTDTFTDKLGIDDVWPATGGGYWVGNFSGIAESGGLLYYNGKNTVYVYDPATGESRVYLDNVLSDGRYLFGLYVKDGELYGRASTSPNSNAEYIDLGETIKAHDVLIDDAIRHGSVTADLQKAVQGKTVTLTVTPDDGFTVGSVAVNGTAISPVDGVYRFEMPDEDAQITASFEFEDGVSSLTGYMLTLRDGDIGLKYIMQLSDAVAANPDAYMEFTVPSGDTTATQKVALSDAEAVTVGEDTYYYFKCGVAAKEMSSLIKAQIVNGSDRGKEYFYSVKAYSEYMLENAYEEDGVTVKDQAYADAAPLVKAMLNYGTSAQVFFDNHTDDPANASLSEADRTLGEAVINVDDAQVSGLPAGVTFSGATLSLKSLTTLSLYFESDAPLSFSCNESDTVETFRQDGICVARIRNIKPTDLGKFFTLRVGTAGTVSYSPMNYCAKVLSESQDVNLRHTVTALYWYYKAAEDYFA